MKQLFNKEWKLATLILTKLFMLFGVMALLPGYPILMSVFFIGQGIFQSFQSMRENNDILYSTLLPIAKKDIVSAKFILCLMIEGGSFLLMAIVTCLRMTVFANSAIYRSNVLMTANLCFLGFALLSCALFNLIFVGGFFRTAYYTGKPFIQFIIADMLLMIIAEGIHYVPGFAWVNSFGVDNIGKQLIFFICCAMISVAITMAAWKRAQNNFEKIDL